MPIDQAALIRAIYDTIFAAYTQPPSPGLPAANQPESLFLSLEWPGQQLDPSQFSNPWSPQNLQGSPLATEFFANLVNAIPVLSATYLDSGITVEEMYNNLLLLITIDPLPNGEPNPLKSVFLNARKTFDFSQLASSIDPGLSFHPSYATPGNWYDAEASKSWAKVTIRSADLKTTNNSAFNQAGGTKQAASGVWKVSAKTVTKIDSEQIKRFQRTLPADPAVRSQIQSRVKLPSIDVVNSLPTNSQPQLDYLAAQEVYDNAVANLNANRFQYDLSNPTQKQEWDKIAGNLEAAVQSAWGKLQRLSPVDLEVVRAGGIIKTKLPNLPNVENLESRLAVNSLTLEPNRPPIKIRPPLKQAPLNYETLKRYLQIKDDSLDQETSDLQISFRFCRVAIRRPWLTMSLLKLKGWKLASQEAGSLSTGRIDNNPGLFPLLPTAFIAIRDLEIRGTWGKKDQAIAQMAASGSGTVGFGPFALNGRYGTDQAGATYTAKFDGQTLSAPGLQILGWINQVVPYSPPLS
ncbi:hypothetical protein [Calothrix sp. PCC 7507]|uniref:hypothetical protein n=1 Tax=Calothrix sp. PCC 7507 TaxID=99598 RepID=UPI00029EDC2D|nr:hypothetical protein [Calothrix sp. PCC 7507]AFY36079.1 hypothetical protein Cal7507_5759 [Calothrix sp. PCC 7507]